MKMMASSSASDEEIFPEDSASNVDVSPSLRSLGRRDNRSDVSKSSSRMSKASSLQIAMMKEIKLAADRELIKQSNEIKQRKRILQKQMDEEIARRELEVTERKLREDVRRAEERVAQLQLETRIKEPTSVSLCFKHHITV